MMDFMQAVVIIAAFIAIAFAVISIVIFAAIEAYDHFTGADDKRQAELARLRLLEEERDDL